MKVLTQVVVGLFGVALVLWGASMMAPWAAPLLGGVLLLHAARSL